jgi:hypothetical protein
MTGSAAAALTGLMFVVISLVTRSERGPEATRDGVTVFSSPTVLHFAGALLVSAILSAPWRSLTPPAVLLGLAGAYGLVHVLRMALRAKRLSMYTPDREDWVWYTLLPSLAYGSVLGGAVALCGAPFQGLFALGAGVVVLIFIGIRNAWDVVTFITIGPGSPGAP